MADEQAPTTQDTQSNSPLIAFDDFLAYSYIDSSDLGGKKKVIYTDDSKPFRELYEATYAKAMANPYTQNNNITGSTIYELFNATTSATNLDYKYRLTILDKIKNSGLLRTD